MEKLEKFVLTKNPINIKCNDLNKLKNDLNKPKNDIRDRFQKEVAKLYMKKENY